MNIKAVSYLLLCGAVEVVPFSTDSLSHHIARASSCRRRAVHCVPSPGNSSDTEIQEITATDALAFLERAKALRKQASTLQKQLNKEKEERNRKETEKVDSLIDMLLFHGTKTFYNDDPNYSSTTIQITEQRSEAQLMNTEEQVAELLIKKRLNYDQVNQMFDRICELANRPQSIDSCSPLLSLLLDAACKVDCLERENNPNKRWNHRVERNLRQKLFALGYGIRIEDIQKKNDVRSITGEKDYS